MGPPVLFAISPFFNTLAWMDALLLLLALAWMHFYFSFGIGMDAFLLARAVIETFLGKAIHWRHLSSPPFSSNLYSSRTPVVFPARIPSVFPLLIFP